LNFSKVDSSLSCGQISGEFYVEKGLERALKVDRESFHETDPHYLVLQDAIFQELRAISSSVIEADKATLEKIVTSATNGKVGLSLVAEQAAQPIALDNGRLLFNPESNKWAGSTAERLQSQKILLSTKAAVAAGASTQELVELLEGMLLK
jgi:hypothetical protein